MYESHFGLTGSPFRLNPDPSFYYGSKGHSHALAYLKYGLHQGEGFIVVTGEIGAGKTTVVGTLLQELDTKSVVAAHIVSTQLESGDLLRSILAAYGVRAAHESKAHIIATLEAFLTALAAQGRRALLIVDEAQNLQREAIEELRMLSNFQLGSHALLQTFLVGQPELRLLLKSRAMEQLRQRVIASCHIEPLDLADTRDYIEHRLRRVGWIDSPSFGPLAFEQIFQSSGGVPRRINRLCNRLLLASYLSGVGEISEELVRETATELRLEISEVGDMPAFERGTIADQLESPAGGLEVLRDGEGASDDAGALIGLCDSPSGLWQLVAVAQASRSGTEPTPLAIIYCGVDGYAPTRGLDPRALPVGCDVIQLELDDHPFVDLVTTAALKIEPVLADGVPSGVIAHGSSDALLICALVARNKAIDILRVDAGRRVGAGAVNAFLLDHLGEALYAEKIADRDALLREGVPSQKAHQVGNLASSLIRMIWPMLPDERETLALFGLPSPTLSRKPFSLLSWQLPKAGDFAAILSPALAVLRALARGQQLIWPLDRATLDAIRSTNLARRLSECGVAVVEERGHLDSVALLRYAVCLVHCGRCVLADEATALGKPVVALGDIASGPPVRKTHGGPAALDVREAARIVDELLTRAREEPRGRDALDAAAAARVARLMRPWLQRQRPASLAKSEAPR
jgi:putative secretion ATPase (PEP-CTERM system associated)